MARTSEISRFTVKPGEEEAFLAKREAMRRAAKRHFEGLIDVTLVKLDDGSYVDVVLWEHRDACQLAIEKAGSIQDVAAWLAHVDEDNATMDFGAVVDTVPFAEL